jgi:hypothetical protein
MSPAQLFPRQLRRSCPDDFSLREVSVEHDAPITLLQDLQGPKIRVGQLPNGVMELVKAV